MGAGDDLMVTGQARVMQQTDPRRIKVAYKGVIKPLTPILKNNPRIAGMNEGGDHQILHARDKHTNMRPYHTAKTAEKWSYNLDFRPDIGEIYFTEQEQAFGAQYPGRVIIEPHIKQGASPNKQWGFVKWSKVAWLLSPYGLKLTQMGPAGTPRLQGVEFIETGSFRLAAAVIANAKAVVLPEGGLMHAAAAVNVPGVIIFGGYIPVEITGYPMHVKLGASLDEACGMRAPCEHCKKWMASISPEHVVKELLGVISNV